MSDNKSSGGVGFTSLLLLAFIILKLTHFIDWSWWWVLSPLWIPLGLVGIGFGVYFGYLLLTKDRRKRKMKEVFMHQKPAKSKWQERLEAMQAEQKAKK